MPNLFIFTADKNHKILGVVHRISVIFIDERMIDFFMSQLQKRMAVFIISYFFFQFSKNPCIFFPDKFRVTTGLIKIIVIGFFMTLQSQLC